MARKNLKVNGNDLIRLKNLEDKINVEVLESGAKSEVEKGERFCKWILRYMFERTEEEIEADVEISGKGDNSVDAWFEEPNNLNIIQAKFNKAHDWGEVAKFLKDIERLIQDPYQPSGQNDKVFDLASRVDHYTNEQKEVTLYYITNTDLTSSELSKISYHREHFEKQFPNTKMCIFGLEEIKEFLEQELNHLPARFRGKEVGLLLVNKFITDTTCVAEISIKDFAQFVEKNNEYLFYSNIRNYLKNTSVNKNISTTFREKPTDFWYYNNGVTIVCDDFEIPKTQEFKVIITTPQIVNGCQTANTIYNEWRKLEPEVAKHLQGSILVKIIKDPNSKRRDSITRFTNNQNAISGKDFYALDQFHKRLQKDFEDLGYYYEIQRKAGLTLNSTQLKKFTGNEHFAYLFSKGFNNILPVREIVQTYAAGFHLMPATASTRSGELAPYSSGWSKLFNSETPEDPYHFLFPYGVMQYAKKNLGYDNRLGKGFRKNCLMLFVTTYFKLLVMLLKVVEMYDPLDNINPLKIDLTTLKKIFENEEVNKIILRLTDATLEFYMRDTSIKKLIDENLPKFLKSPVQTNATALEGMINHIKDSIENISSEDLENIKHCFI